MGEATEVSSVATPLLELEAHAALASHFRGGGGLCRAIVREAAVATPGALATLVVEADLTWASVVTSEVVAAVSTIAPVITSEVVAAITTGTPVVATVVAAVSTVATVIATVTAIATVVAAASTVAIVIATVTAIATVVAAITTIATVVAAVSTVAIVLAPILRLAITILPMAESAAVPAGAAPVLEVEARARSTAPPATVHVVAFTSRLSFMYANDTTFKLLVVHFADGSANGALIEESNKGKPSVHATVAVPWNVAISYFSELLEPVTE